MPTEFFFGAGAGGAVAVVVVPVSPLPITTVASAAGAAVMPRMGRQPAMDCGREIDTTVRPASMPAHRPFENPGGLSWTSGLYLSSSMRSKALGGALPVMA